MQSPSSAPEPPRSASADDATPNHWIWGIDLSTRDLSIAVRTWQDQREVHTFPFSESGNWVERLASARLAAFNAARTMNSFYPVLAVFIEQPTNRSPSLQHVMAAVSLGLHDYLNGVYEHPVSIFTANIASWKKLVVGHGHANKQQIREFVDSRFTGAAVASQDEADALCIAEYGWRIVNA